MQHRPENVVSVLRGLGIHDAPVRLAGGRSLRVEVSAPEPDASHKKEESAEYGAGFLAGRAQGHAEGLAGAEDRLRDALASEHAQARSLAAGEGYEEGLRRGAEQAAAEARRVAAQQDAQWHAARQEDRQKFDAVLARLAGGQRAWLEAAEDDMVVLCFEMVCHFLGESALDLAQLARSVGQHLAAWEGRARTEIHVHPEDLLALRECGSALDSAEARWVASESVVLGGLRLLSAEGDLDARLDSQLAALRAALVEARWARSRRGEAAVHEASAPC